MQETALLNYGPVRADEINTLNALLEQALTFGVGGMAPWIEAIGHTNTRAVRRDGRTVAGLAIIPMAHWFGGVSVPTGGITAVGVAPDQRGSGVGLWMLRQMLDELHKQDVPLATLYPATTAFYRRAGFERAAHRVVYEAPLSSFSVRDYTLDATPAGAGQHETLKQLYRRQAEQSSAFIDRPDFYWKQILEPKDKPAYAFLVSRDGVPEGYVVFLHAGWNETLMVRDIVALTPGAGRRIMTLLADHRSMIETVRFVGGANDMILFLMPEQKQKVFRSLDLMLRIVNVTHALSARGYPPSVQAELHLDLTDELLPANNGRWVLRVADGRGVVEPGGQGRLRMHVRDLAALYTGYYNAIEQRQAGTLTGEPADLAAASLVFSGPRPWLPDMF